MSFEGDNVRFQQSCDFFTMGILFRGAKIRHSFSSRSAQYKGLTNPLIGMSVGVVIANHPI